MGRAAISDIGLTIGRVGTDYGCKLIASKSSDHFDTFGLSCRWMVGELGCRLQPSRLNYYSGTICFLLD